MFILQKAVLRDACHGLSGFRVSKERIAFIIKGTEVLLRIRQIVFSKRRETLLPLKSVVSQ